MKKQWKKIAAFCLSGSVLGAAIVSGGAYHSNYVLAQEAEEGGTNLAIAGNDEQEEPEVILLDEDEATGGDTAEADGEDSKEKEADADENQDAEDDAADEDKDGSSDEKDEKADDNADQDEDSKEEKKVFDQLETTHTGDVMVNAIDVSEIVSNNMPSIVSIVATSVQEVEDFFYGKQEYEIQGGGSGIIIAQNADELLIATNNHVVADSKEITICFTADADDPDDLLVPGVVKGTSGSYDLAVVAVRLSDIKESVFNQLKIATLGSSNKLKVGETAISIGNALGVGQTVTVGIISALEREVHTQAGTFTELQTDAAINLGCSGGAILNARGEVIGIISAKSTANYAESMGYGIPIDTAIPVLQELINRQTREVVENHGYLGITVVPVSEEAKQMYSMPAGAFVYEVSEGSAAEKAGIVKGDIVTRFDGVEIDSSTTLVKTLGFYEAGETVTVELQSSEGGKYVSREVEVTLQEATEEQKAQQEEEKKAEEKEKSDDSDNSKDSQGKKSGKNSDRPEQGEENRPTPPVDDGSDLYEGDDSDDYYGGEYDDYYNDYYDDFFGGFGDFFFGGNGNGFGF